MKKKQDAASNRMKDLLNCTYYQEVYSFKIPGAAYQGHHESTCSSQMITMSNEVFMD